MSDSAPDLSQIIPQQQMPDLGQPTAQVPALAGSPGSTQYEAAKNQPPRPSPILLQLIRGLVHPQLVNEGPGTPARPQSRLSTFEDFLGNFVNALGHGLSAARGPGAFGKGFGAAMGAPYEQSQQQFQMGQQTQANQAEIQQRQAQTELTQTQAKNLGQMVTLPNGMMVPMALAQKMMPAMFQAQGRVQAAQIGGDARIKAAQLGLGPVADVPKELQDQLGLPAQLPLKMLNQAESAANRPLTTIQGANDQFQLNRITGKKTALGVGSPRIAAVMARPVQVADPDNPGGVKYMPAGEAMRQGAQSASSAAVTVPKAVMKDFTSGTSAKTLNNFNTATDHLRILSQLGDALDNGSVPLINRFANAFATATGGAAPTTFNMAKQAVAGEVAKTFKGQATEGEIAAINSTLNAAQSPQQLKGAIGTALRLMESKRAALMTQYDSGIKGATAFPRTNTNTVDSLLKKHGF